MSGVLRDGRESGLYQYTSKLNIEGSTVTCAYVSSHPAALHWASISTQTFLKLAKMISSRGKKREKTAPFCCILQAGNGIQPAAADAGVKVRARSIEAGRGGRPGPWEKGETARSRGSASGGEGGDDREGAEGVPQT